MTLPLTSLDPGSEVLVNTVVTDNQVLSQVVGLDDGSYVVVWRTEDGSGNPGGIYAQIYNADGTVSVAEFRIDGATTGDPGAPVVTALAWGGFVVAWQGDDTDGSGIHTQTYDDAGTPVGTSTLVNTVPLADPSGVKIVGLADGGYVVTWTGDSSGADGVDIYLQRYDAYGATVDGETVVNTTTAGEQSGAVVTGLADGGYVVAWTDITSTAGDIYVQRFGWDGSMIDGETLVNTTTAGLQNAPAIAALKDGGYVVTWNGTDSDGPGVFARQYDAGGNPVASEFPVNTVESLSQRNPSVTGLSDGGYVIVWESDSEDGSGYGVYAQRFDAAGGAVDAEMLINSSVNLDQGQASVTALADGGFTVTWSSAQNGSDFDIYTTRWTVADTLGNPFAEVMDGSGAAVHMIGGDGNDTYIVDSADDTVTELPGEGHDLVEASVSYALSANVEDLTLTGSDDIDGAGNGDDNYILGNSGNNALSGGGGGNDTLVGGDGDDLYYIDNATTLIVETDDEGYDSVIATVSYTLGAHIDAALLMPGTDNLNLTGNALVNVLVGNDGNNVLDGKAGPDLMQGGGGNDTYYVNSDGDVAMEALFCGCDAGGTDLIYASANVYMQDYVENVILLGTLALEVIGNEEDNNIRGNVGDNTIDGYDGDDVLDGGAGADTLFGGAGNDTYYVDNQNDQTIEDYVPGTDDGGTDTVYASVSWTLTPYIENLYLTGSGNIDGTGSDDDNSIVGSTGNNVIDGGLGADTMTGRAGDDTYIVDDAGDMVIESAGVASSQGVDTVVASISYTLRANVENLSLSGAGNLTGTGNGLNNLLTGNDGDNVLDGKGGADTLYGGIGNDTYYVDDSGDSVSEQMIPGSDDGGTDLVISSVTWTLGDYIESLYLGGSGDIDGAGNGDGNTITGSAGKNMLDGGAGADTMIGRAGDDTYVVDDAGDRIIEYAGTGSNQGNDTVLASISYALRANVENLTLTGGNDINATGNSAANILTGNSANNVLDGKAGDDTLYGGAGHDTYYVDSTGDSLSEQTVPGTDDGGIDKVFASVSWTLGAGFENLSLTGASSIDATGNSDNNALRGNSGDNVLRGMAGNDSLIGYDGADTFRFEKAGADNGHDTVYGFVSGVDHLAFSGADYGISQPLDPGQLTLGTHAAGTAAQFVFNTANHVLYWDSDGSGATAAVAIALLSGVTTLAASDFVFV